MAMVMAIEAGETRSEGRGRFVTAFVLVAPLMVFLFIPNAVTLVTLSFVGRLGSAALAGMGIANVIFGMVLALLFGFDTGAQAMVSRATGAGAADVAGQALSDAVAVSASFSALLAAALFVYGPRAVALLLHDPAAAAAGGDLLHGLAPMLFLLGITIPFNAYWIASGVPKIAFFITLLLAPLQIAATWMLVLGMADAPRLGVFGAGVASSLTSVAGLLLQLAIARRRGVMFARPWLAGMAGIVRIGWPISVQQSFVQFGLMIAYAIVSQLGTGATAMLSVLASLTMAPLQAAAGIGGAAATLVGQALGRGDARDAWRWGWQLGTASLVLLAPFGAFAVLEPRVVLGAFMHDRASIDAAVLPVQLLGASLAIDGFVGVMNFALRGAGATKAASAIPFVIQWLLQMPAIWLIGIKLGYGMTGIVMSQVVLTCAQAVAFVIVWQRQRWADVRLAGLAPHHAEAPAATRALERVLVMGGAGAGKSTLARKIGERLGLPVLHLDRFVFGPNWTRVAPQVARERLIAAMEGGHWVIDGMYPQFSDLTLAQAELVLWIEQPWWRRLWRTWRKTRIHRGKTRADRPDGAEEAFGWRYVRMVLSFGRFTRDVEQRLRVATTGDVRCLKDDRGVQRFVESLPSIAVSHIS